MYEYYFTCCKTYGYEKQTLDEDFKGWKCRDCGKQVTKDKLHRIGKKEGDVLKVLYDYETEGPYRGLDQIKKK